MRVVLIFLKLVVLSVCKIQDEFAEFKVKLNYNEDFKFYILLIHKYRKNIIEYTKMIVKKKQQEIYFIIVKKKLMNIMKNTMPEKCHFREKFGRNRI